MWCSTVCVQSELFTTHALIMLPITLPANEDAILHTLHDGVYRRVAIQSFPTSSFPCEASNQTLAGFLSIKYRFCRGHIFVRLTQRVLPLYTMCNLSQSVVRHSKSFYKRFHPSKHPNSLVNVLHIGTVKLELIISSLPSIT